MITIPVAGGPLKRTLVEMAYSKMGLTGYELGRTPEETTDALSELDAMMLEWPYSGLGYVMPAYGTSAAEEQSGIPNDCRAAVSGALALRLAPNMGKTLSPEARASIERSIDYLRAKTATIPTTPMARHTPRGAGSKFAGQFLPFIDEYFADVNPPAVTLNTVSGTGAIFSTTGSTTVNSDLLTVASATGIVNGQSVAGSGIPSGATVIAISGNVITISANATATASGVTLTFGS